MTSEKLWELRNEIRLNSIYYTDYENSFGIDCHAVCDFFDGYLSFLDDIMGEDIPELNDSNFYDYLPDYDNEANLYEWYGCFEVDPLPIPDEENVA